MWIATFLFFPITSSSFSYFTNRPNKKSHKNTRFSPLSFCRSSYSSISRMKSTEKRNFNGKKGRHFLFHVCIDVSEFEWKIMNLILVYARARTRAMLSIGISTLFLISLCHAIMIKKHHARFFFDVLILCCASSIHWQTSNEIHFSFN